MSEICLGTMTFGGNADAGFWTGGRRAEPGRGRRIVRRALDAGVNFFDTADVYSFGGSERLLGQAFKNLGVARKDVVIATKVFGEMGPGPNDRGASRGHIMDSVQASLERLQTDHIDLYQNPRDRQRHPAGRDLARARRPAAPGAGAVPSACPTGRPGASPRRWGSARPRAGIGSRPCNPTIPSPAATWSASWSADG
ncbi:MAG: aldo/keto reductase [Caulobacteraceae bacterium]